MLLKINNNIKDKYLLKVKDSFKQLFLLNTFKKENNFDYEYKKLNVLPAGEEDIFLFLTEYINVRCKFNTNIQENKNINYTIKNLNLYKILHNNTLYLINSDDVFFI